MFVGYFQYIALN